MRNVIFTGLLVAAVASTAQAEFSNNYFELGYTPLSSYDGDDAEGQDFRLRFPMTDHIFFNGYVAGNKADDVFFRTENYGIGIGTQFNLRERLDVYGTAAYEHIAIRSGEVNTRIRASDQGYGGELGLRFQPVADKPLELTAEYDYDAYEDDEGQFFELSGYYPFYDRYGVTLSFIDGEYELNHPGLPSKLSRQDWRLGLRVQF